MPDQLVGDLIKAGLLQFGRFDNVPFRVNLDLLPSYPDIMRAIIQRALEKFTPAHYDHLVSTVDSVPFGLALSLNTDVPLVYSKGSNRPAVYDLIGAYDVGHPALMVTNVWSGDGYTLHLIEKARSVGLEINTVLPIIDCRNEPIEGVELRPLLRLDEIVTELAETGRLPVGQAQAVKTWMMC